MLASGDQLVTSFYKIYYERMIVKIIVSKLEKSGESWEEIFVQKIGSSHVQIGKLGTTMSSLPPPTNHLGNSY